MDRLSKRRYYLNIARQVATRSTCLRSCYGAVIVKDDEIISTGYNGAPRGRQNCSNCGFCLRNELGLRKGERYELCRSVHAEMNAIISASRESMSDATLYLSGYQPDTGELIDDIVCCAMCERMIINSGIKYIIYDNGGNGLLMHVENFIMMDDVIPSKAEMVERFEAHSIKSIVKCAHENSEIIPLDVQTSKEDIIDFIYSNIHPDSIRRIYYSIANFIRDDNITELTEKELEYSD